jgi:hypothetical protein
MNVSLLDLPPPPGAFDNLDEPLIPNAVDMTAFQDIYVVGKPTSKRWRSFINAEDWSPKQFHDQLMKDRAYHARCVWEASMLISYTDSSWLSTDAFVMIKDVANYSLRQTEFEILSFQLTAGMIGIILEDQHALYRCATVLYLTMMTCADLPMRRAKITKEDRKLYGEFVRMKPLPHDSKKSLGVNIDEMIHAIHCFIGQNGNPNAEDTASLAKKMQLSIEMLDPIIKIIEDYFTFIKNFVKFASLSETVFSYSPPQI